MAVIESRNHGLGSEFRINCKQDGIRATFQIGNEVQGFFTGDHDISVESVRYKPNSYFLGQRIRLIEYEGWRRHVKHLQTEEGVRIIFHLRSLGAQTKLARLIDYKKIGWLEPINANPDNPILAINFCEELVEKHPYYIDRLFEKVCELEEIPPEVVTDLKTVIAHNCLHKFFRKVFIDEIGKAQDCIRPTALDGVASPFYLAAAFCIEHTMLPEARELLRLMSKVHWQYEEGTKLERQAFEMEIAELKDKITRMQWRELYPSFDRTQKNAHKKSPPVYQNGITLNPLPLQEGFGHTHRLEQASKQFTTRNLQTEPHFPAIRFSDVKEHKEKQTSKVKQQKTNTKKLSGG